MLPGGRAHSGHFGFGDDVDRFAGDGFLISIYPRERAQPHRRSRRRRGRRSWRLPGYRVEVQGAGAWPGRAGRRLGARRHGANRDRLIVGVIDLVDYDQQRLASLSNTAGSFGWAVEQRPDQSAQQRKLSAANSTVSVGREIGFVCLLSSPDATRLVRNEPSRAAAGCLVPQAVLVSATSTALASADIIRHPCNAA